MKITCFLPCRKGSERIKRKNIRPFAGYKYGLIEIKLRQLSQASYIEHIILSTNDEEIIDCVQFLDIENLEVHKRKESLSTSFTSTDSLINHVPDLVKDGHVLWTHVTSPFLNSRLYDKLVNAYKESLDLGYDSLMTTTELRGFIWNENQPINYDRSLEKWPRTQTIEPLHEINSGAFICHIDLYKKCNDRIGRKPKMYPLSRLEGFDIDWPEDFTLAQCLLRERIASI